MHHAHPRGVIPHNRMLDARLFASCTHLRGDLPALERVAEEGGE